jgi:putative transposase
MKVPADLYTRSTRPYTGLGQLSYPFHDRTVTVTQCGRVCYNRQKTISVELLPDRKWESSRSLRRFGWLASCNMT